MFLLNGFEGSVEWVFAGDESPCDATEESEGFSFATFRFLTRPKRVDLK